MKSLARIGMMFILPLSTMITTSCNGRGETFTVKVANPGEISQAFLNIDLECTDKEMRQHGYFYGDIVQVTVKSPSGVTASYDLPYVTNYNEAGTFGPCLCDYESKGRPLGVSPGFNTQEIFDTNCFQGGTAEIKMKKADGYLETRNLVTVTNKLSYQECGYENTKYANCRDVVNVGDIGLVMKPQKLYRGSTPICGDSNKVRYEYSDKYCSRNKIAKDISLSLTQEKLDKVMTEGSPSGVGKYMKERYDESHDNIKTVNLGNDWFNTTAQKKGGLMFKKTFDYLADNSDEDFYIHCNEGKDRTGFMVMVIEALCGVSLKDIVADYMLTFCNYYNITEVNDKKVYDAMANLTCYRNLYAFMIPATSGDDRFNKLKGEDMLNLNAKEKVDDLISKNPGSDYLSNCAATYLSNIEVSTENINKIKTKFKL